MVGPWITKLIYQIQRTDYSKEQGIMYGELSASSFWKFRFGGGTIMSTTMIKSLLVLSIMQFQVDLIVTNQVKTIHLIKRFSLRNHPDRGNEISKF